MLDKFFTLVNFITIVVIALWFGVEYNGSTDEWLTDVAVTLVITHFGITFYKIVWRK